MTTTTTMILTSLPERLLGIADETMMGLVGMLFATTVLGFVLYTQLLIAWRQAESEGCINISVVTIRNGVMRIFSIRERNLRDVILSPYARWLIRTASKKTTPNDLSLRFKNFRDELLVYDGAGKAISSMYGTETLAAIIYGNDEQSETLFFDIIWERNPDKRMQKVNIIVVRLSTLQAAFPDTDEIRAEIPDQESYLTHLGRMYAQHALRRWPVHKTLKLPRA